jgi:hypothetical protein
MLGANGEMANVADWERVIAHKTTNALERAFVAGYGVPARGFTGVKGPECAGKLKIRRDQL